MALIVSESRAPVAAEKAYAPLAYPTVNPRPS
jgi:hypothetical protein